MNPAHFQTAGGMGPMPNMQMSPQQPLSSMAAGRFIVQTLQNQGPFTGWQATISIEQRTAQVKLLVDSLRLLRPVVDYNHVVSVAINFEMKCFTGANNREEYVAACRDKLERIRDQRQQQNNPGVGTGQLGNMNPMQMQQQMNQNMMFPPQSQQQMQPSPMPNQQRMTQNMMNPNQSMPNGLPPQGSAGQPPNNIQQQQMTPEENKIVNNLAAQMAQRLTPADKAKINAQFSPEQRQVLSSQGWDPMLYYFRSQALKQFRRQKMLAMTGNSGAGMMMAGNNNNAQMQNQMQNLGAAPDQGAPQYVNMARFQGQQADGLRSQEAGQLVVPASNSQGMTPEQYRQQMIAGSQRQQPGGPGAGGNFMPQQQQVQQSQPELQDKAQTIAQYQAQSQAQARNQAAARAQMGLPGQASGQGPQQTNTPASMLSRPVAQNLQGNNPQMNRPASRAPGAAGTILQPGQQPNQMMAAGAQANPEQREILLARFPPALANVLKNKPMNEWAPIVNKYKQQTQEQAMRRSISQQPAGSQPQLQQTGLPQPPNSSFLGGSNLGPTAMQASLSAGPPMGRVQDAGSNQAAQQMRDQQYQRQLAQNQDMMQQRQQMQLQMQQQQQRQQNGQANQNAMKPSQPMMDVSPEDMAVMDRLVFPPQVSMPFQKIQGFPTGQLRTWGDLKQWLTRNPQPNVPMGVLLQYQRKQFMMAMNARNAQNPSGSLPPGASQMQQQSAQMMDMSYPQSQQNNMVQNQPTNMAMNVPGQLRPIDDADVQRARQIDPRLVNIPDPQLKAMLMKQRQTQFAQRLQEHQRAQAAQAQNPPISFMPPQTIGQPGQPPNAGMVRPASGQSMGIGSVSGPGQMPLMGQNMARPPSVQQTHPMQRPQVLNPTTVKGVKRANDDDVVEVPNPANNPPAAQQGPRQLTKEQFEKLTPPQRQSYLMQMRRSRAQLRVVELTKQVQGSMPQLRPIKNMNAMDRDTIRRYLTSGDTKQMLEKFDQFIIAYVMMEQDDDQVKKLLTQKLHLVPQYIPQSYANKTYEPVKDFSVPLTFVETTIKDLLRKFQQVLAKSTGQTRPPQAPPQAPPQVPPQAQPQAQPQAPPQVAALTPENLGKLQAQEAQRRVQKGAKASDIPPAPTSTQPPFQLGDPRGQGTPRYANPGLKQEDLKLDPKRRKKNPPTASSPPVSGHPNVPRPKSPETVKEQAPPPNAFKCPNASCDYRMKGFATEFELNSHLASVHKPVSEQVVSDPIAFLDEESRKALDLDVNGQPNKKTEPMQKTSSKSGISLTRGIKQEKDSKPSTPTAMARGVSQVGIKSSPGAARTPQPGSGNRLSAKVPAEADPWANSNVSLNTLRDSFGVIDMGDVVPSISRGAGDGQGIGVDLEAMMEEFMQTDAWTKIQPAALEVLSEGASERGKSKSPAILNEVIGDKGEKKEGGNDLLVDLHLDGMDLAVGGTDLDMGMDFGPNFDGDAKMADSWELPELGGDLLDEFNVESSDNYSPDSWEDWLKMEPEVGGVAGNGKMVVSGEGEDVGSPFEEIDWDATFAEGKDLSDLQAGAGPLAKIAKGLGVGGK